MRTEVKYGDIFEYDNNGNCVHYKTSKGKEAFWDYDENDNMIHYKDSDGLEY